MLSNSHVNILYLKHAVFPRNGSSHSHSDLQCHSRSLLLVSGHWQCCWCHLIGHLWLPISLPLQLRLYLVPLPTLYQLFSKIQKAHTTPNTSTTYDTCTNTHQYQCHIKFEVPSFTHSNDIIGAPNFKMGHVTISMALSGLSSNSYGYEDMTGDAKCRKWGWFRLVRVHARSLEIAIEWMVLFNCDNSDC